MSKKLLGIDLGGTSVKMAILTLDGDIQQKWTIPTNILDNGCHIVPDIIASIQHHLHLYQLTSDEFLGIGMGSPGQIDENLGTVIGAYNLGWSTTQYVKKDLEKALNMPVFIDNDANVAALGERWVGAGNNANDVVFITLGTGVGGGIIANEKLVHGVKGSAGEIGHLIVEKNGFTCTCGKKGCLETVASATGIVNLARAFAEKYAGSSSLKELVDDGSATAKDVFDLAKQSDVLAEQVVEAFAKYLGVACSHLANILNPAYIVIGGGVSAAGEYLLEKVDTYFKEDTFITARQSTQLRLATLGNDAGVIGAASLVLQ
ncbi:ROK family glucokinase [Carnobacteriaceae bacterium zg-ZUI78]|nr:ROK family glucokinase [Carnobacteriaceae bacterium zg-ZUI78]